MSVAKESNPFADRVRRAHAPPAGDGPLEAAQKLLAFEESVRAIDHEGELSAHLCNATRTFVGYRQAFFLRRRVRGGPMVVVAASSIPVVDRDAPMVRSIEGALANLAADAGVAEQKRFLFPAYADPGDDEAQGYPFAECCWTPLKEGDEVVGGLLAMREAPWRESDAALLRRFSRLYVHALRSLSGRLLRKRRVTRMRGALLAALLAALAVLPAPITSISPVEAAPADPFVVAAPFDGVVKEILADANAAVVPGDDLVLFEDVEHRNRLQIAEEREAVAEARYLRASQGAISVAGERREIAVARAEFELAKAERAYAEELLAKTRLQAATAGVAIIADAREWVGRPVRAGEAIMEIADPDRIRFAIDLPVKESLVLKEGALVKIFLDADPLHPIRARLTEASYQARLDKRSIVSYRVYAELEDPDAAPARIGVQGVAQIHGRKAPLIYVVLRRPLSALRQATGI